MTLLRDTIIIQASLDALFALTQDYNRRLDWDPFLSYAKLLDNASTPAVGRKAWCVSRFGLGMETEYVRFQPPYVAAIRMTKGPFFLKAFAGSWRFREMDAGSTEITFVYSLKASLGILTMPLSRIFAYDTRQRLRALKKAAETTNILEYYVF